ncbi:MAG: hypothetical protein IJ600_00135 [Lachnospiraceae bacterium]|nr:hypothetical protein [Lachnospiraceae bacterium]
MIPLTTEGKNVIVLMLDRAIGAYVPFIFEEKPELKEQFDGFAFYPNTVSFGKHTNYGAPALFGGYDYTPAAMEQRTDMNLMEKHDEALKVMPVLFEESGGKVTIGKLPFIHYKRVMDVSFLSEYENIDVFDLNERYAGIYETDEFWNQRIRNFCFYSLFKIAPVFLQDDVYDSGAYFTADWNSFMNEQEFLQSYASLKGLSELTDVTNTKENTLFIYDNETPHEPVILPLPDYDLTQAGGVFSEEMAEMREVDGITLRFDQEYQENSVGFYHVNMATMLTLGKWFDELRENGVYDNTRIILVADHGGESGQFDHLLFKGIDVEAVNPLLMVKDFDSHGFLVDNSFMTNADVPSIALSGLVEIMKNPFTGNELAVDTENKAADIIWADDWDIDENNGIGFQPYDAPWYHVKGVISDPENWERVR